MPRPCSRWRTACSWCRPRSPCFPRFSQHAAEGNWAEFRSLTVQTIRTSTFLAAPVSALLLVLAPYAVSIYNLKTAFDPNRFEAGAGILAGWALALIPWAVVTILLRTFYARERTREAVIVSAVGFVLEVGLYRLLVPGLGLFGFGLSTTISGLLMAFALALMYQRSLGFPWQAVGEHLGRVVPLAMLAGLVAWAVSRFLPAPGFFVPGLLGLAVAGGAGLLVYLLGATLLKMPEMAGLRRRLRR